MTFDPDRLYRPDELAKYWPVATLATWRSRGGGPDFIKAGKRVLYSGADLNRWIEEKKVKTRPEVGGGQSAREPMAASRA